MNRVLITGGSGFLGRHVVEPLLEKGCEVAVVGRAPSPPPGTDPRVRWVSCDLTAAGSVQSLFDDGGFDTVVHLAWETRHGYFWAAPENLVWNRISLELLEAFGRQGGTRFVGVGTCVEYAPPQIGPCIVGTTPVAPEHLYAVAKDAFHRVLRGAAQQLEISSAWGRVFLLVGPDEAPARLVPSVINSIHAGGVARCSSGTQVRDFMDVRDCGAALAALALSDFDGPINLCSGEPRSIREVVTEVAAALGAPEQVAFGALPDRPGELPNLWGDARPLHESIGFQPRYTFDQTLADAAAWWTGNLRDEPIS